MWLSAHRDAQMLGSLRRDTAERRAHAPAVHQPGRFALAFDIDCVRVESIGHVDRGDGLGKPWAVLAHCFIPFGFTPPC